MSGAEPLLATGSHSSPEKPITLSFFIKKVVEAIIAASMHSSCRVSADEYSLSVDVPQAQLDLTGRGLWSPAAYEMIILGAWLAGDVIDEQAAVDAAGLTALGWCSLQQNDCSVDTKSSVKAVKLHKPGQNKLVWKGELELPTSPEYDPRIMALRVDLHGADGAGVFEAWLPKNEYDKVLAYGWKRSGSGTYLFKSKYGYDGVKKLVLKPKGNGIWKYTLVSGDVTLDVREESLPLAGRLGFADRVPEFCSYTEFLTGSETRPRCILKPGKVARCR